MGIGIVLLFWAVVGTILASIGAAILGSFTARFTNGSPKRRRAILVTSAFPFLCLGWAGALFIFQAIINETVFHRDPGLATLGNVLSPWLRHNHDRRYRSRMGV